MRPKLLSFLAQKYGTPVSPEDVVAYIADVYLRGWLAPRTTVQLYPRLGWAMPKLARLIWEKQGASVQYSSALIVPSAGMKRVLLDCYPQCPSDRIRVMPWGAMPTAPSDSTQLRQEFGVPANAKVILTMSRLSPEKGIDGLLKSLAENERDDVWLFVCGEAAFMKGEAYRQKLDAVFKAIEPVAKALWEAGCRSFFVARPKEGEELRELLPHRTRVGVERRGCERTGQHRGRARLRVIDQRRQHLAAVDGVDRFHNQRVPGKLRIEGLEHPDGIFLLCVAR